MADEDLKYEILDLKKRLHNINSENYLLKVKVRKLQSELSKKDKQIDSLLDPKKSSNIAKIVSERGASMILNLTNRNSELEKIITIKDAQIKKLESFKQTSKIYSPKKTVSPTSKNIPCKFQAKIIDNKKFRSRSLSTTPIQKSNDCLKSNSEIELDYARLSENLQKIKNATKGTEDPQEPPVTDSASTRSTASVESDKIMHYEIWEIKTYLVNILDEMENMKKIISQLTIDQDNTKKILKNKNRNIEILTKQIKVLNKNKFKSRKSSSAIHINNKYSSIESENKDTYSMDSFEEELSKKIVDEKEKNNNIASDYHNQLNNIKQYLQNKAKHSENSNHNTDVDDDNDVETGD